MYSLGRPSESKRGPEGTYHHLMVGRALNAEENKKSVNKTDKGTRPYGIEPNLARVSPNSLEEPSEAKRPRILVKTCSTVTEGAHGLNTEVKVLNQEDGHRTSGALPMIGGIVAIAFSAAAVGATCP